MTILSVLYSIVYTDTDPYLKYDLEFDLWFFLVDQQEVFVIVASIEESNYHAMMVVVNKVVNYIFIYTPMRGSSEER